MKQPNKTTVLVVDDEKMLCQAIARDFQKKGYNTLCAYNGREAFELVKARPVDLIISDVRMPGGDGIELLNSVKAYNTQLPIMMFITGFTEMSIEEAYNMGADAVFAKPFNRKALMEAADRALEPSDQKWNPRSQRVHLETSLSVQLTDMKGAELGRVLNVGRGGIFVSVDGELPERDTLVRFKIAFQHHRPHLIEGEGIVRWVRPKTDSGKIPGCGIEFVTLNSEGKKSVLELINAVKTKAFIPNS